MQSFSAILGNKVSVPTSKFTLYNKADGMVLVRIDSEDGTNKIAVEGSNIFFFLSKEVQVLVLW